LNARLKTLRRKTMGLQDMYSAISGMQADSSWLDVIGNNIANSNTTAYKSSAVSFVDSLSQTLATGTGDNSASELGGVDPRQVGTGTRVQAITANWTEGTIQQTGVATDVAISGNGFLISKSGADTFLTRAGNLTFDSTGNLVDANGGLIQGYTAGIQQTETTIETAAGMGNAAALQITKSAYVLNDLNTSAISNININPNMTMPPAATTQMNFIGNLDAAQQVNGATGGVEQMFQGPAVNANPVLPLGVAGIALNAADFTAGSLAAPVVGPPAIPAGVLIQAANLSNGQPLVTGAINLAAVQAADVGTYAWEQQPPVTPALTSQETVYDSNGDARTVTVQFYQVNDIGGAGINKAAGPSQTAYAWYAFDTTGGAAVSTANLVGGTGIIEGEGGPVAAPVGYNRGVAGNQYWGDLVIFNTDGSLASTGGVQDAGGVGTQAIPDIYLPPLNPGTIAAPGVGVSPIPSIGAEITQIKMNFGTAGLLGKGQQNGLTGDAEGTTEPINGVNTYVPDSHATVTQDGFAAGALSSLAFDATGKIQGSFTNGQTIALAQVAMVTVENEGGLSSVGNNYYQTSINSGAETIGLAGSNGAGTIQGGSLEGSNVNLTTELSNMIIAQRGFEVNARVITVESQNLQTLTQLGQ
jgi:flagellar hook protein FlgE